MNPYSVPEPRRFTAQWEGQAPKNDTVIQSENYNSGGPGRVTREPQGEGQEDAGHLGLEELALKFLFVF